MPQQYIDFPHLPEDATRNGAPVLNRYSTFITKDHDFPAAKAMLYAAGVKDEHTMETAPHVGIASVWWEGNPCNMHLLDFGKAAKTAVQNKGMLAWQYNAIGVSDAITMGHEGMRFSLQTREIIADSIETVTCAQCHDACIAIAGCDKNMPGVVMGMARHNRPSLMIYGGTIEPGYSTLLKRPINISTTFEVRGAYDYGTLDKMVPSSQDSAPPTGEEVLSDVEKHACPGAGACGGMYTANTMATAIETMGLSLPGSSSTPATSPAKLRECVRAASAIEICLKQNITPRKLLTRAAFINAIVMTIVLGGSTNAVLHFLAMARSANVDLTLEDVQRVSSRTPVLADMAPAGRYFMADLHDAGGIPAVHKFLIAAGLLDGTIPTVTGNSLAQNVQSMPSLDPHQQIIRPLSCPLQKTGHLVVLYGNLAPDGAIAKLDPSSPRSFTGIACVFDSEAELDAALTHRRIPRAPPNVVLVVRNEGPRGGPGMPEQLKASGSIIGAGLDNVALVTDGRYSGASHGLIIVGHICPESFVGGPIAIVRNGDTIRIDADREVLELVDVDDTEINNRLRAWIPPPPRVTRGTLAKYARLVAQACDGAVTDVEDLARSRS